MDMQDISSRKFIPVDMSLSDATESARSGSMGIGAHPDDLEILAIRGIGISLNSEQRRFTGVAVTDGSGGTRKEHCKALTEDEIAKKRLEEQNLAAMLGKYALQYNLMCKSADIRDPDAEPSKVLVKEISDIVHTVQPNVIYTHSPFDNHPTHVAVMRAVVEALRSLPGGVQPLELYGCEVWGSLDWLPDGRKKIMDVTKFTTLQRQLISAHESQHDENRSYEEATVWREFSNAAWACPRIKDVKAAALGVDLMPLLHRPELSIYDFAKEILREFEAERLALLNKYLHREP